MSGYAMEWAHELATDKRLPLTVARVLFTLAYHAGPTSGRSFPSVETLADETGLGRRTIQRAFGEIERRRDPDSGEWAGLVDTIRRTGNGGTTIWLFPQSPQPVERSPARAPATTFRAPAATVMGATVAPEQDLTSDNKGERGANATIGPAGADKSPGCPHCYGTGWRTGPGGQSYPCRCGS